jgi:hypothetical protein
MCLVLAGSKYGKICGFNFDLSILDTESRSRERGRIGKHWVSDFTKVNLRKKICSTELIKNLSSFRYNSTAAFCKA